MLVELPTVKCAGTTPAAASAAGMSRCMGCQLLARRSFQKDGARDMICKEPENPQFDALGKRLLFSACLKTKYK